MNISGHMTALNFYSVDVTDQFDTIQHLSIVYYNNSE